ncbi:MAG: type IV pilus twitching motility protein PilT [bacterium]|nr:type IV pilus twitching motility protein PilT [bacterium]
MDFSEFFDESKKKKEEPVQKPSSTPPSPPPVPPKSEPDQPAPQIQEEPDKANNNIFSPEIPMEKVTQKEETVAIDTSQKTYSIKILLKALVDNNGSDLHVTVGLPPIIRIHGKLTKLNLPPLNIPDITRLVNELLSDKQRIRFKEELEIDFSYEIEGLARFRVNAFNQRLGPAAVFRVIPTKIKTLEELGVPKYLENLSLKHKGFVLVTGPTGSGKSTTLAALVDKCNASRYDHIITIEDPIEFVHFPKKCIINQREVGPHTHSFSAALKSALREDPDIILVGEMRDFETISLAITAAETGHLVFATLHTISAAGAIDRIIDVFPPHQQDQIRTQLSDTIVAIIAQQLIPTKTGKSRCCAIEVLMGTAPVKNLIREGKTYQLYSTMQTSMRDGMQTLDQALKELVKQGLISGREAYLRAHDKNAFKQYENMI